MDKATLSKLLSYANRDKNGDLYIYHLGENNAFEHLYLSDLLAKNIDICIEMVETNKFPSTDLSVLFNVIEDTSASADDILRLMQKMDKLTLSCATSPITGLTIAHTVINCDRISNKTPLIEYLIKECNMDPNIKCLMKTKGTRYYREKELNYIFKQSPPDENGYSLLEWAVWQNECLLVLYLLTVPNINPSIVKFITKDNTYWLSGTGFPSGEKCINDILYHAIQDAKYRKSDKTFTKDIYNRLFHNKPLNAVIYSDPKLLAKFAQQYSYVIRDLFEEFDGNAFRLTMDESIVKERMEQLETFCTEYHSLYRNVFDHDCPDIEECSYEGLYPRLNIKGLCWIRNLLIDSEGGVFIDKIEVTLQDPCNTSSVQEVVLYPSEDDNIKIEYPDLGKSVNIKLR